MRLASVALLVSTTALAPPSASGSTRCPDDMVRTPRGTCIDRFEWPNRQGAWPTVGLSAHALEALCSSIGKRTCSKSEWVAACEGPGGASWPYGATSVPGACNDDKRWRAPNELAVAALSDGELLRLYQGERIGSHPRCESKSGARDMTGSVEEWVRCTSGRGGWCLMGRYWSEPASCGWTVTVHDPGWSYYETGGRCCSGKVVP